MKQSINSVCNSIINRNQTMKYILTMAMFFALTSSVLAEGGARVFEYTYSHRIRFTDPSNNPSDALGISNPVVGVNITGGVDCVPGIANCVGGSNAVGTVDSVYYVNGVMHTVQSVNTYKRVKMGKYYNPTDMSKTDKTFSHLTDLTFTLKKGGLTVWAITIPFSSIPASSTSPFTFNQNDALSGGQWLGEGSIYKDSDGAIHFTSAPLITSTLDVNSTFELTVTPTVTSSTIVSDPNTQTYLGADLCAKAPKTGETKYSSISSNHEGWYLMDGAANSGISNVNAKAAAYYLFGGSIGNIPNMDGLYTVAETSGGQAYNAAGVVNNQIIVNNSNIQAVGITTSTNGSHSHDFYTQNDDLANQSQSFGSRPSSGYNDNGFYNWGTAPIGSAGSHDHSLTVGVASPTPISIQPRSAKLYQFVYLGK